MLFRGGRKDLHTTAKETGGSRDASKNSKVLFPLRRRCGSPSSDPQPTLCRLYEQLEEVQQQKAVRSRQEASTLNRLKAKEFHKVLYWSRLKSCSSDAFFFFLENPTEASCQADAPLKVYNKAFLFRFVLQTQCLRLVSIETHVWTAEQHDKSVSANCTKLTATC